MFTSLKSKLIIALVIVIAIVAVIAYTLHKPAVVGSVSGQLIEDVDPYFRNNGGMKTNLPMVTNGGVTVTNGLSTDSFIATGDVIYSSTNATSTPASMTLSQSDISVENILDTPTVGNITLTLPATSTLTSLIPIAGQSTGIFIGNATTTSVGIITIAGGAGMNMTVATGTNSSTIVIAPKKSAMIRMMRMPNSDINVMLFPGI